MCTCSGVGGGGHGDGSLLLHPFVVFSSTHNSSAAVPKIGVAKLQPLAAGVLTLTAPKNKRCGTVQV